MPKKTTKITETLKVAIKNSSKTVYQLAKESGVSPPIIHRFLSGERDIRGATINKLAAVLGLILRKDRENV